MHCPSYALASLHSTHNPSFGPPNVPIRHPLTLLSLCADTGVGSDDAEQAEKRRRFMELRKKHYNMRDALKK